MTSTNYPLAKPIPSKSNPNKSHLPMVNSPLEADHLPMANLHLEHHLKKAKEEEEEEKV